MDKFEIAKEKILNLEVGKKYTLITSGGFGVCKTEITLKSVESAKYAQYHDAIKFIFRAKNKRKDQGLYFHFRSDFVVVEGTYNATHDPFLPKETTENGVSISKGKYMSCDSRFLTDAIEEIQAENKNILVAHQGF